MIALLATLKAGAAYLPLDLKQPAGRLADVLVDSRAALLIGAALQGQGHHAVVADALVAQVLAEAVGPLV
ncbi:AMP-binding protein [Pseudomonas agronomica]|uniref:AMP-binding protein n=1 Tax=Pseudomonas agronomica TaxID=2979328 RepID=UPI002FCD92BD